MCGVGRAAGHEVAQCAGWGGLPAMRWHYIVAGQVRAQLSSPRSFSQNLHIVCSC